MDIWNKLSLNKQINGPKQEEIFKYLNQTLKGSRFVTHRFFKVKNRKENVN